MKIKKKYLITGNLALMLIAAIILIAGVLAWLDKYTRHGEGMVVPDIKGMPLTQAEKVLRMKELAYVIADSNYVKEKPAGCVLEYNPAAGQTVKKGRTIYLIINRQTIPEYDIPDVAENTSLRQAEAGILAAGFKLAPHEFIDGEKDWVYGIKYKGQRLAPEDKVPLEAVLTLVVGNGQEKQEDMMETGEDADAPLFEQDEEQ